LAISSYDSFPELKNLDVVQLSWDRSFTPAAAVGKLRIGSAQPTSAAPTVAVSPWSGDLDEVFAIRGAQPAPANGVVVGPDIGKWSQAIYPYGDPPKSSPCT
jgi:hypothetical protein